jgi:hypothetical protein
MLAQLNSLLQKNSVSLLEALLHQIQEYWHPA